MSVDRSNVQFEQYKLSCYESYGTHPRNLFNFFYENNDIFGQIAEEDMNELLKVNFLFEKRRATYMYGSFVSVLLLDQVAFRLLFPSFRIPRFRFLLNIFKYIGVPFLADKYCHLYRTQDVDNVFEQKREKYNFNFEDYTRVMRILERAYKVGRLEELLKIRSKFDWTGVPE